MIELIRSRASQGAGSSASAGLVRILVLLFLPALTGLACAARKGAQWSPLEPWQSPSPLPSDVQLMYPDPSNHRQLGRLLPTSGRPPTDSTENPCQDYLEILPTARSQEPNYQDRYQQELTIGTNVSPGGAISGLVAQVFGTRLEWNRVKYVNYVVEITDHQQVIKKAGYEQCCTQAEGQCGAYLISEVFKGQTKLLVLLDNNSKLGNDQNSSYRIDELDRTINVPTASGASVTRLKTEARTTAIGWGYYRTTPMRKADDAALPPRTFWHRIRRDPTAWMLLGGSLLAGVIALERNQDVEETSRELAVLRDSARTREEQIAFNLRLAAAESIVDRRDSANSAATTLFGGLATYVGIRYVLHWRHSGARHEPDADPQRPEISIAVDPMRRSMYAQWLF